MSNGNFDELFQKGIRAARRGRKDAARRLLGEAAMANPQSEEAWLWLARVIDDPAQKADCLQRVLTINPDNRWAADQLAALQAETAAPEAAEPGPAEIDLTPVGASELKLELLTCPSCGGSVEIKGGDEVQTVVCSYCGSVLDLTAEQAAVIGQTDRRIKPAVPLELGMEGTFEDEVHQVVGWVRYEGWDEEETWQWDEWLLVSAGGQFRWLSYSPEEGFQLYKKIEPVEAFDPRTARSIKVPGGTARVRERSPARIVALDGELTWRAKVGETLNYLDARRGDRRYSVEYTAESLDLSEGYTLSEVQVWQAFGRQDLEAQALQQKKERRETLEEIEEQSTQTSRRTYLVLAAIVGVIVLFACCPAFLGGGVDDDDDFYFVPSLRSGSASGSSVGGGGTGFGK